jgi:hypothetical protein
MEKIDTTINLIREMMIANMPGSGGGFGGSDIENPGPAAGTHASLGLGKKKSNGRYDGRSIKKTYKQWMKHLNLL